MIKNLFFISVLLLLLFLVPIMTTFSGYVAGDNSCSDLFYNCGSLKGIGYPFWGGDRPQFCGIRPLQLQCEENQNTVLIMRGFYIVRSIEASFSRMTIARYHIWSDICLQRFTNTSWLNFELFNNSPISYLTIFYGCPFSFSGKAVPSVVKVQNNITCSVNGRRSAVAFATDNNVSRIQECTVSRVVPVQMGAHNNLLNGKIALKEAVQGGFTLEYKHLVDACKNDTDIPYCSTGTSHGAKGITLTKKIIIGATVAGAAVLLYFIIWCCIPKQCLKGSNLLLQLLLRKGKTTDDQNLETFITQYGNGSLLITPRRYSFSDIKKMTYSFREKLGEGGFSDVYKGYLSNGVPVAVKLLKTAKGNGEEFINEVASISRTSHVNVITLLGFCLQGTKRALIYEFLSNGSCWKIG